MIGQEIVYKFLKDNQIPFDYYEHPEAPTIEIAAQYYRGEGTTLCKNLFFRNHKGNKHYLVILNSRYQLDIHDLEHRLHQGKLSFASPERMDRCLGLSPGSVSALGLIHDIDIASTADPKELFENGHRVKYFIDKELQTAPRVSFHPCDNTASVVLTNEMFLKFLSIWGGEVEWLEV